MQFPSLAMAMGLAMTAGAPVTPPDVQAAFFKKILHYDETLRTADHFRIGLVYRSEDDAEARAALLRAFLDAGLYVMEVRLDDLPREAAGLHVVYVQPRAAGSRLRSLCEEYRLLSISGDLALVESGAVAVGVRQGSSGRPEMMINVERLERERHQFSSSLLTLAKASRGRR